MQTDARFIRPNMPGSPKTPGARFFQTLHFVWRWIGTGLSFTVFGIGSFLLGIVIMPLIVHLVRNEKRRIRWSRLLVGKAMRFFRFFMNTVGVLRYEITGTENIRPGRGYLIIANHPSLIDVVFLLSMFPTAECVIKQELQDNFWTKHLMKGVGYISNRDPVEWLNDCVARLRDGQSLILFPEGTRTVPGRPLNFKAGAAAIAVRANIDCLPIVITCTPTTLTKAERWYQVPTRRVFFSLKVQPPISAGETLAEADDERQAGRSFNNFLLDYFTIRLAADPTTTS
jgi:1-acyl-sn-glycerol-3-phosphate acyltransferase